MRLTEVDSRLREWAYTVLQSLEDGLDGETITAKLMECGVMVKSGVLPVPNYWPTPELTNLNNIIMELPLEERNFIIGKRILRYSYMDLAKFFGIGKTTAYDKTIEIEKKIGKKLALANDFSYSS